MAFVRADFVKETSAVTGTGNITLAGARSPARTFASVCANGDTFRYAISNQSGPNEWEVGLGTYNAGANTITRSPVASSNGGGLVNFSVGTKFVDMVVDTAQFNAFLTTAGAGLQTVSLATFPGALSGSLTNAADLTIGGTNLVLQSPQATLSSNISGANVVFFASGQSLAAAAWLGVVASTGGGNVQHVSFVNANGMTFLGATTTAPGFAGALAQVSASYRALRSISLGAGAATITSATDTQATAPQVFFLPFLATSGDSFYSLNNVSFKMSTNGATAQLYPAAWFNVEASGGLSRVQNISFSNGNGVTFGLQTTTIANSGGVAVITASVAAGGGGNGITTVMVSSLANSQFLSWSNATDTTLAGSSIHLNMLATVLATGAASLANVSFRISSDSVLAGVVFSWLAQGTNAVGQIYSFSNANNVSWQLSTVNGLGARIVQFIASVNTSLTNVNVSAGTTSNNLSNVVFSNSNGVSFGLNGNTVTGSIATSLTNINVSAGTTSQNLSAIVFSNSNGVSFGLNGSTVTASVAAGGGGGATHRHLMLFPGELVMQTVSTGASRTAGSLWLMPMVVSEEARFQSIVHMLSFAQSTSQTASMSYSNLIGIYTREGNTGSRLSLVHSISTNIAFTLSGSGNTSLHAGAHLVPIAWTSTITPGEYWMAFQTRLSMNGGNTGSISLSLGMVSQAVTWAGLGFFNQSASNITRQFPFGQGFYSATTAALPGTIAFNQINANISGQSSVAARRPWLQLLSNST